ncbi:MAG: crossover junction endodeoxyribonuclease RuvC [Planctomycetia bacterium]|nr:crossover junction endodeoxyribonuclease RuvC [Planctomycetia bacterium]
MIILGIDPGINITGYAILEKKVGKVYLREGGVIRGKSRDTLPLRLLEIHQNLEDIFIRWKPKVLALEEIYSHYQRPKTAIIMGHVRGTIMLLAAQNDIPVYSYSATAVKKILTGSGRASKSQMQRAIQTEFSLEKLPDPPDLADALAIALCHCWTKFKI